MVGSPLTFAGRQTLPSLPPEPSLGYLNTLALTWFVRFDQVLRPGSLDLSNFVLRHNLQYYPLATAEISGLYAQGTCTVGGVAPAGDFVDYLATPKQIRNMALRTAAAFADYPIGVA